jgi:uncharacterized protein with NRDE domain
MCLLVLAWRVHPRYRAIVAANRDEFHARAAAAAAPWPDAAGILAGRDLQGGGTWLGVGRDRRFGIVTNYREHVRPRPRAPSRGGLIPAWLGAEQPPGGFLAALEAEAPGYSGFNLLLADAEELWFASNRADVFARPLRPGIHGLGNHTLDTPWPKLQRVRSGFEAALEAAKGPAAALGEALLSILADRERQPPDRLRDTGSGLAPEWEHVLSSPFVLHPEYGTRCSTVLLIGADGSVDMLERRFDAGGERTGESEWRLNPGEWPLPAAR